MAYDYTDRVFEFRNFDGTEEYTFSLREFTVLLVLCNRADKETGECYGGYFNLAKDAHMSRSSLQRAIKNLEGLEIIRRDETLRDYMTYFVDYERLVSLAKDSASKPNGKKLKSNLGSTLESNTVRGRDGKTYTRIKAAEAPAFDLSIHFKQVILDNGVFPTLKDGSKVPHCVHCGLDVTGDDSLLTEQGQRQHLLSRHPDKLKSADIRPGDQEQERWQKLVAAYQEFDDDTIFGTRYLSELEAFKHWVQNNPEGKAWLAKHEAKQPSFNIEGDDDDLA